MGRGKGLLTAVLLGVLGTGPLVPTLGAAQRWESVADTTFQHPGSDAEPLSAPVLAITQDHEGFLWVGTEGGVARWDGHHYRIYSANRADRWSLPDNYVQSLHVDAQGELWIGTLNGGLSRYDRGNDRFITYRETSGIDVRAIADDGSGGVWAATSHGLDEVSSGRGVLAHLRHDDREPGSLPEDNVKAVIRDGGGRLWIGTRSAVVYRDSRNGPLLRVELPRLDGGRLTVTSLYADMGGDIWIGTEHGVYVIPCCAPGAAARMVAGSESDHIESIVQGDADEVWVGTYGAGILIADVHTLRAARRIQHDPVLPASLDEDTLWSLYRDRTGDIWSGTNRGLSRHDPNQHAILTVFGVVRRKTGISDGDVEAVLPTPNGQLWLGLGALGIDILDPFVGRVAQIRTASDARGKPVVLGEVRALTLGRSGEVFIGARSGLYRASLGDTRPRQIPLPGSLGVRAAAVAADGESLWLGSLDDGLWVLKLDGRDQIRQYLRPEQLTDARISVVTSESPSSLWVGTFNGLNHVDPTTGSVERIVANPDSTAAIAAPYVSAILVDAHGRVWIGTQSGGLSLLEGRTAQGLPRLRHFGRSDGLPNLNVDAILEAPSGMIWVATDAGLAVIDPAHLTVRPLSRADGVMIPNYWINSGAVTSDGVLAFGGAGGLTLVRAERLASYDRRPPVVVTEIRVGGKVIPRSRFGPGSSLERIQIMPEANSLTVEFAALDYSAPERNRYGYWLEGYDRGWIDTDSQHRSAAYTNLPPGRYILHLRGSNRTGVWSEHALALPIQVRPSWYQTFWFKAGGVLAVLGAMGVLVLIRTAYLRARQRELERVVAAQTAQLRERERQLEQLAYLDPLTGLGNRRMLTQQFDAAVDFARRGTQFALLLIDLDRFKQINDSLGHDAGDALLIEVSRRLKAAVRQADQVFRIGGDEFAILFAGSTDTSAIEAVCRRISQSLLTAVSFNAAEMSTSPSIGIARFPADGSSLQELFKIADLALYEAKRAGRGTWRWSSTGSAGERTAG